jgi:hypothetical protein
MMTSDSPLGQENLPGMPRVAALYRYPVKGLTPEACGVLTVQPDGRIAGDRVLGFGLADGLPSGDVWGPKNGFLVLMNTPGLTRLHLDYDERAGFLRVIVDGTVLVEGGLDEHGRERLADAVARYALSLEESPLAGHPERLPVRLLGDGVTARFQDREPGFVTLHGRSSLAALASASEDPELSERRFRSNVAVDGLEPWQELEWLGRTISVGALHFEVARPIVRCLATHANPLTGKRDRPILTTLSRVVGQDEPTFGVALSLVGRGGVIRVGDEVRVEQQRSA